MWQKAQTISEIFCAMFFVATCIKIILHSHRFGDRRRRHRRKPLCAKLTRNNVVCGGGYTKEMK